MSKSPKRRIINPGQKINPAGVDLRAVEARMRGEQLMRAQQQQMLDSSYRAIVVGLLARNMGSVDPHDNLAVMKGVRKYRMLAQSLTSIAFMMSEEDLNKEIKALEEGSDDVQESD